MSTLLITHNDCLEHDTGPGHPEHPGRLSAVLEVLQQAPFETFPRVHAELAEFDDLLLVHEQAYLEKLFESIPLQGRKQIDADTCVSPASGRAGLGAVGAVLQGIEAVTQNDHANVFCAVRPPGHHAEPNQAMGFCLFNAIAIGAQHALKQLGMQRVAIIDFDVHHGNGTQTACWDQPDIMYVSSHQMPLYPGTGAATETGNTDNIINLPLSNGSGSSLFRAAYLEQALPRLKQYKPDLILVSAGFDAHHLDPLAGLNLETDDFSWITQQILNLADTCCEGRVVSVMEGGYSLAALKQSAQAHVLALAGQSEKLI